MAPQQDLAKIGLEGFELIDAYYGPPSRRTTNGGFTTRQRQGRWGVQATHDHGEEEPAAAVINSKDAAYKYDGIMIVNYPKSTKPQNRWGKIFKPFKS